MSLLGLPTELIDGIVCISLMSGGFESFVCTCRTIHDIGKSHIPRYNLLRKWKSTALARPSYDEDDNSTETIIDILRSIAENPDIADFIEELDLSRARDNECERNPINFDRDQDSVPEDAPATQLRRMAMSSTHLSLAEQDKRLWLNHLLLDEPIDEDIARGIPIPALRTVFLLTLLPNLRTLTLPGNWQPSSECTEVLNALVAEVRKFPDDKALPLAKLECLSPFKKIEYDSFPRCGLKVVAPFMALPHLEHMHVSDLIAVDDGYTGIPFHWHYGNWTSGLRALTLAGCCIDPSGISDILACTPNVISLSYSHHVKWHGCGYEFNAAAFIDKIGERAGANLVTLSVTLHGDDDHIELAPISFEQFASLEQLTLDVGFLARPSRIGHERHRQGERLTEQPTKQEASSLADVLPHSVKRVKLQSLDPERDVKILQQLFKDPQRLKPGEMFPYLQRITIEHFSNNFMMLARKTESNSREPLYKMLEAAGVEVEGWTRWPSSFRDHRESAIGVTPAVRAGAYVRRRL